MKIYSKKLLIADMDGTLLNSKRELESNRVEAINCFVEQGGLFTIATGRMETTTREYFPELKISIPAIFYNGALIFDMSENKPIWEDFLPKEVREILNDILKKWDSTGCEVLSGGKIYVIKKNKYTELQREREGFIPVYKSLTDVQGNWYKILLADEKKVLEEINTYIQNRFIKTNELFINTVFSEENLLEILNGGTSKGKALGILCEILKKKGFRVEKTFAVGDGNNDIELLNAADVGIVVSNACEGAKTVADYTICDNDQNVICECLKIMNMK